MSTMAAGGATAAGAASTGPAPYSHTGHGPGPDRERSDRSLPPVPQLAVASMALVIIGGIYMAAHLPARPPLGPAAALVAAAGALVLVNMVLLVRLREFAWPTFFLVAKWSLLAYLVITGMLEFIFILDGTRGATLVLLTFMLAVFAVDVPVLLGFSVARYQPVPEEPAAAQASG
jgi:hypothetical protein